MSARSPRRRDRERDTRLRPGVEGAGTRPGSPDRRTRWALVGLALVLHLGSLAVGYLPLDLIALEAAVVTAPPAFLRGGLLAGGYAPLSREFYWWWWGRAVGLDALAFHALNAAIAVGGAVIFHRAVERVAGARTAQLAVLAWMAFPPLGTLLAAISGARELIAAFWAAAALLLYLGRGWIWAGLASGAAALSGPEGAAMPLVLLAADRLAAPRARLRERLPRLAPALALTAAALFLIARAGPMPASASPPGPQVVAALARAWAPEGVAAGVAEVWRSAPWAVLLAALLAALAVPAGGGARPPALGPIGLGAALALAPLLPLAGAPETLRPERLAVPALGVALGLAALLGGAPSWVARVVLAAVAVASLGANALPAPHAPGPLRFTGQTALRERSQRITALVSSLRPWCRELAQAPRTFVTGLAPDSLSRIALGPGARAVCRDPRVSVRFVAELEPADAVSAFGVLRPDREGTSLRFERADARVRAQVAEGLLLFARPEAAAACFEAAAAERPEDPELVYPTVVALAAAGRSQEAGMRWEAARRAGRVPSPDTLAVRLLAGPPPPEAEAARREVSRLAAAVLADPSRAGPHLELGRRLLELGRARSATLEFSVASGIRRVSQDLYWLARGYDAMGARDEALETYRVALSGGLDSSAYRFARARLVELLRATGAASR